MIGLALAGCAGPKPAADPAGPMTTLTLDELVARVNANNERLPSLWSSGRFEAIVKESPEDAGNFLNGTLVVQHLKPDRLRLNAEKDLFGDVFDLGTDGENLWLRVPRENVIYVGTKGNLDPRKTGGLPIRPDLILQVLAINLLPDQFAQFPAPVLRVNPDARLHLVSFVEPAVLGEPRLKVAREVWYDVPDEEGATPLPVKVILSDDDGRPVLAATLEDHRRVGDLFDAPVVATRLLLYFPQTGGKMRIDLEELLLYREGRGRRSRRFPNESTFAFDPADYPEKVVSLDFDP